jgi:ATP-dependent DNA helicase DinG
MNRGPLPHHGLSDFFDPGGILSRELQGYEFRPGQKQMAEEVLDAITSGQHLVVEAGTGTGKTLAYLAAIVEAGVPAVISTGTRHLQEQLFYRDLPFLAANHPADFSYCYLKGRANYLCRHRLALARRQPDLFPGEADGPLLDSLQRWSEASAFGDFGELHELQESSPLLTAISARRETCLGSDCNQFSDCFVTLARQRAQEADLVVVNHHLLFSDMAVREGGFGQILPPYRVLVFDEAHLVEDVACAHFGSAVSRRRIDDLGSDTTRLLTGRAEGSGTTVSGELQQLAVEADLFFGALHRLRPGGNGAREDRLVLEAGRLAESGVMERGSGLALALEALKAALGEAVVQGAIPSEEAEALSRRAMLLREELGLILKMENPDYVYWCELRGIRGGTLHASPIEVAPLLEQGLFGRLESAILTSATLAVGGDLGFIRRRLGAGDCRERQVPSPFLYEEQAILYLPPDLPEPSHPEFIERAAERMAEILAITGGRAFLLFTSYRNMHRARTLLEGRLPYPLLSQGEMPKRALIDEFRAAGNAVLLATRGFWQGVDVRGEALSAVVVDRLPFEVPTEPLVQARMAKLEAAGENPFFGYQVPGAVIELKQGLGRLIRSTLDYGLLAVLDNRITRKRYGRIFLDSLPAFPTVSRLSEVEAFFRIQGAGGHNG